MHCIIANIFKHHLQYKLKSSLFLKDYVSIKVKNKTIIQLYLHALIQNWFKIYINKKKLMKCWKFVEESFTWMCSLKLVAVVPDVSCLKQ